MRRIALLALVFAVLPAGAWARTPCELGKHDRAVTRSRQGVIAERPNKRSGETVRGCLKSTGRWRTLHVGGYDGYSGSETSAAALGGRYAAVAVFSSDHYNAGTTTVEIVNLHTGHRRPALEAGFGDGDLGGNYFTIVELAVSRRATLGWIAVEEHSDPYQPPSQSSVVAHDAAGTRVLDTEGGREALKDVRFAGTTLRWTHLDEDRSAQLGGR